MQRLPYAQPYSDSETRALLNSSEGRPSPVNNQAGHPRQHVGRWEKAEKVADHQQKTKSVYANTASQDAAVASALSSAGGQQRLADLDGANALVPKRTNLVRVPTSTVDVKVVKAKKKGGVRLIGPLRQGEIAPGEVKSWVMVDGQASAATVIVDSRGTGRPGDIHIQTAFPVLE